MSRKVPVGQRSAIRLPEQNAKNGQGGPAEKGVRRGRDGVPGHGDYACNAEPLGSREESGLLFVRGVGK